MFKIVATEEEKLNKKGEYVKLIKQDKYFFGMKYNTIVNTMYNRITQEVMDSINEGKSEKGKNIGFGN